MKNKMIYFGICIFCLAAVLLIEQFTNLDVWISNQIYDFEQHRWPIKPALHQRLSPVFYAGAKHFVAFVGTICVIYVLGSLKKRKWRRNFAAVLTVLLCTIIVPTVVGSLKKMTNVYCPIYCRNIDCFYSCYRCQKYCLSQKTTGIVSCSENRLKAEYSYCGKN